MNNIKSAWKTEFIKCINQRGVQIVFTVMLIASLCSFCAEVFSVFGKNIMFLRPVVENVFSMGIYGENIFMMYIFFFPLLCASVYSDSYLAEKNDGSDQNYYIRMGYRQYLFSKVSVAFTTAFLVVVLPMFLNLLMCLITFPLIGADDFSLSTHYMEGVFQMYFMGELYEQNSMLFLLITILINGVMAGLFSVLAMSLSTLPILKNCNRNVFLLGFFIIMECISILFQNFNMNSWNYAIYLKPLYGSYSWMNLLVYQLVLVSVTIILMTIHMKRKDFV